MSWSTFVDLGGIAGFLSLGWQALTSIRSWRRRPALFVQPFNEARDLAVWDVLGVAVQQKVFTLEVSNRGKRTATRCVARLNILSQPTGVQLRDTSVLLHWAGTDYTPLDTGAQPVDIGSEHRRLDVVFARNINVPGSWIAAPLALSILNGAPQFFLPPGRYEAEVILTCEDGDGCRVGLRIDSPPLWDQLSGARIS